MQAVTTIGLDIAKSVFQVHGVDAAGQVLIRCQLKRRAVLAFFQKRALPDALVKKSQPLLSADSARGIVTRMGRNRVAGSGAD